LTLSELKIAGSRRLRTGRAMWWLRLASVVACGLLATILISTTAVQVPRERRLVDWERWSVTACHGRLHVARAERTPRPALGGPWPPIEPFMWEDAARRCGRGSRWLPAYRRTPAGWGLCLPLWPPAIVLIAVGIVARPRRRHRPGRCDTCGYDLAGLKDGVCPECGRGQNC
jgi:hypothetical protein